MIKCVFSEHGQLNSVTLFEKHILSFSKPTCCEDLAWQKLKGLAELANLTVYRVYKENFPLASGKRSQRGAFQSLKRPNP